MYKLKNALLHGALFAALLLCPAVGFKGNGETSSDATVKPSAPAAPSTTTSPTVTEPQQGSGVSASGVSFGIYAGPSYGYYRPNYYYYPYQPYYYSNYYYPYRPYYNNYGW